MNIFTQEYLLRNSGCQQNLLINVTIWFFFSLLFIFFLSSSSSSIQYLEYILVSNLKLLTWLEWLYRKRGYWSFLVCLLHPTFIVRKDSRIQWDAIHGWKTKKPHQSAKKNIFLVYILNIWVLLFVYNIDFRRF